MTTTYNLKKTALFLLMIPLLFILFLFTNETTSNKNGRWIHLAQVIPLTILMIVAWKYPRPIGYIILIFGVVLSMGYLFTAFRFFPPSAIILVEGVIFAPLILCGALLIYTTKRHKKSQ